MHVTWTLAVPSGVDRCHHCGVEGLADVLDPKVCIIRVHSIGQQNAVHTEILVSTDLGAGVASVGKSRGAHVTAEHHGTRCCGVICIPAQCA